MRQSGSDITLFADAATTIKFTGSGTPTTYTTQSDSYLKLTADTTNKLFILTDSVNNLRYKFNDFTVTTVAQRGKLLEESSLEWFTQGKSGNTYTYDSNGRVTQITTPTGQDYTIAFTYNGSGYITKAEIKDASNNVLQRAEYTYYQDVTSPSTDLGTTNDLVQVKISKRATKDTTNPTIIRYTQYRYSGTTSRVKAVYEHDAIYRAMTANSLSTPETLMQKADTFGSPTVQSYSSRNFEYYTADTATSSINTPFATGENLNTLYGGSETSENGFVKSETVGGCSACGISGSVKKTYFYMTLANSTSDQNQVTRLVVEDKQDSAGNAISRTVYGLEDKGRTLRKVLIKDPTTSPLYWCESWKMATSGPSYRLAERRKPSTHNVTTASALRNFLNPYNGSSWTNDTNTLNSNDGLIEVFGYDSTTGIQTDAWVKKGNSGTAYYVWGATVGDGTNSTLVTATYQYPTQTTTKTAGIATSYSYTFWDTSTHRQIKTKTTTLPVISTSQNGSGVATTMVEHYDSFGRLRWTQDGEGYINYYSYHPSMGQQALQVIDVDPASPGSDVTSGSSGNWDAYTVGGADSNKPTRDSGLPTILGLSSKTYFDSLGRQIRSVEPGGGTHCIAYENLRTISFPYWDGTNGKTLLPTQVSVLNSGGQPSESFSVKASYTAFSTSSSLPTGFSTEPGQSDYVTWKRNTYDTATGRLAYSDRYAEIPSSGTGTLSTHFYRDVKQYDTLGRRQYAIQVVSGLTTADRKEQVTQTVYDFQDRVTEVKSGVSGDSAANSHNMTDNYTTYPTLVTVSKMEYDGGGVGDGHVTKFKRYFGTGTNDYTGMNLKFTYRGHRRGSEQFYMNGSTETPVGPYPVQDVDWLGRTTTSAVYDSAPTWTSVLTGDGYTAYAASTTTNRRARNDTLFDDLGRVYQTKNYEISCSTGSGSNYSTVIHYLDRNGRRVGTAQNFRGGEEFAYDGAGRLYQKRTVTDLDSGLYASGKYVYQLPTPNPSLGSMTGGDDMVVTLSHSVFDAEGNGTESHEFEATHDDLAGGSVGIDLSSNDDYVRRTTYQWYDSADRLTTTADYGSGDTASGAGTWKYTAIPSRPGTAPMASGNTALVSLREYNSETGLQEKAMDPAGMISKTFYDRLNRTLYVAENWSDFSGATETGTGDATDKSKDRVTKKVYDGANNVAQLVALDANGDGTLSDNQSTRYLYEDTRSASRKTNEIYPDSSDTTSSGTDQIKKSYNVDGSMSQQTDQRGTVVDYSHTNVRQLETVSVTTLGSGVDGAVRSIKRSYDSLRRLEKTTSYSGTVSSGSVVNEIQTAYDDFGAVIASYQAHGGAVNTSTSPKVQYGYDTSLTGNVFTCQRRLQSVTYPNGRVIFHDYDVAGNTPWHRLSMLRKIRETNVSGTELAIYDYAGSGKMVMTDLPEPDLKLDYFQGTSGTYAGWDRFGRIKDQYWDGYGSTADVDRFGYAYDYSGSRTSRDLDAAIYAANDKDQAYVFDGLHRLKNSQQGTLASETISGTPAKEESWTLDAMGNWSGYLTKTAGTTDLDQSRTANGVNEITNVTETTGTAWSNPSFDAAGNMTMIPKASDLTGTFTATYDAWNRLVKLQDGAVKVAEYAYDGENRQIVKSVYASGSLSHKEHTYKNQQWQSLEVRKEVSGTEDPDPLEQYVWHPFYVDSPLLRDYDGSTSGTQVRHFYTFDGNLNVTGLVGSSGAVLERYHYTPYGTVTILDANFTTDADGISDEMNPVMYTGRRFDSDTGLFYYRNRHYHSQLGGFTNRDPLGHSPESHNLYQYVSSHPGDGVDPHGLNWQQMPYNFPPPPPGPFPGRHGPNKKRYTGYLCESLCSSFASNNTGFPPGTLPPGTPVPSGPSGGDNRTYTYPATPSTPIGGGGAQPCIILVVKCPGSVSVLHFASGVDNPTATINGYSWPSGCSAIICGGENSGQSRCAADEVVSAANDKFGSVTVATGMSQCGVGTNGEWYVGN